MIMVFGGAYQGKLEYVYTNYGKTRSVFQCSETDVTIDFSKEIINAFHLFILACIKNEIDAKEFIMENMERLKDRIVICDDITGGVVPIEREVRRWRESAGRSMALLAKNSDEIIRVFCGIGVRVK